MAVETLLVTGVTGFVGSHVLEQATAQSLRIRALVRKEADVARLEAQGVTCVRGSLEDRDALRTAVTGVDAVLHLAAATKARNVEEYHRANVAGTQAVVEATLAVAPGPTRLVYLSSLAATGPSYAGVPISRATVPRPLTAYGRTKLTGEKVCETARDRLILAILRAPAVYGPRDRDVYEFFRLAGYGVIPIPGIAHRRLQMIHAADLARALLLAVTGNEPDGIYHVAETRSYEFEEMACMVANAVGKKARIVHVPGALITAAAAVSEFAAGLIGKTTIFNRDKARELLAPGWLCETELARQDFGFEARISLQAGLNDTAAWYKKHGWL